MRWLISFDRSISSESMEIFFEKKVGAGSHRPFGAKRVLDDSSYRLDDSSHRLGRWEPALHEVKPTLRPQAQESFGTFL